METAGCDCAVCCRASCLRTMAGGTATDKKLGKHTSDSEWRELLSAEEYDILRKKGTERPGKPRSCDAIPITCCRS